MSWVVEAEHFKVATKGEMGNLSSNLLSFKIFVSCGYWEGGWNLDLDLGPQLWQRIFTLPGWPLFALNSSCSQQGGKKTNKSLRQYIKQKNAEAPKTERYLCFYPISMKSSL